MAQKGKTDGILRQRIAAGLHLDEFGNVCLKSKKILPGSMTKKGYRVLTLGLNGQRFQITAARVICWLSHGPSPTSRHEVDHINRCRNDDRPENLRWATVSEQRANVSEEFRERLRAHYRSLGGIACGERHGNSKLSEGNVREIRKLARSLSQREIARRFSIGQGTVSKIILEKTWKHLI